MNDATQTEDGRWTEEAGEHFDVLLAAYLFVDPAQKDYDAIMQPVEDKKTKVEGVVLASKDHAGEMHIVETGDHVVGNDAEAPRRRWSGSRFVRAPTARRNSDCYLRPHRRRRGPRGRHQRSQDLGRRDRREELHGAQGWAGGSAGRPGGLAGRDPGYPNRFHPQGTPFAPMFASARHLTHCRASPVVMSAVTVARP